MVGKRVKVVFDLEDDAWHGSATETMWVEVEEGKKCRVLNSPFYVRGLSYGDLVEVAGRDGKLVFSRVVERGGHSTYRIIPMKGVSRQELLERWQPLKEMGCTYESMKSPHFMLAVDVPSDADIHVAYRLLEEGQEDGVWGFEEGHCGHPV